MRGWRRMRRRISRLARLGRLRAVRGSRGFAALFRSSMLIASWDAGRVFRELDDEHREGFSKRCPSGQPVFGSPTNGQCSNLTYQEIRHDHARIVQFDRHFRLRTSGLTTSGASQSGSGSDLESDLQANERALRGCGCSADRKRWHDTSSIDNYGVPLAAAAPPPPADESRGDGMLPLYIELIA